MISDMSCIFEEHQSPLLTSATRKRSRPFSTPHYPTEVATVRTSIKRNGKRKAVGRKFKFSVGSNEDEDAQAGSMDIDMISAPIPRRKLVVRRRLPGVCNQIPSFKFNTIENPIECTVCMEKKSDGIIIHEDSVHRCCCYSCAETLKENGLGCPVCRKEICRVVSDYYSVNYTINGISTADIDASWNKPVELPASSFALSVPPMSNFGLPDRYLPFLVEHDSKRTNASNPKSNHLTMCLKCKNKSPDAIIVHDNSTITKSCCFDCASSMKSNGENCPCCKSRISNVLKDYNY
jgi:hypothetical protein